MTGPTPAPKPDPDRSPYEESDAPGRIPRWVRITAIAAAIVVLLVIVVMLIGGGHVIPSHG